MLSSARGCPRGTQVAERQPISMRDAEATRRTIETLGLRTSTARYLGLRSIEQLERARAGRAQLTVNQIDQLRLANREREHIERAQETNRAQPANRKLTEAQRDRALLDWLKYGKERDAGQTASARRASIRALAALGFDPELRAIYKRKRKR